MKNFFFILIALLNVIMAVVEFLEVLFKLFG